MIGLAVAIAGYEVDLYNGGWKAYSMISDTKHNDKAVIEEAIKIRIDSPYCRQLRIVTAISSTLCITLMIIRQRLV